MTAAGRERVGVFDLQTEIGEVSNAIDVLNDGDTPLEARVDIVESILGGVKNRLAALDEGPLPRRPTMPGERERDEAPAAVHWCPNGDKLRPYAQMLCSLCSSRREDAVTYAPLHKIRDLVLDDPRTAPEPTDSSEDDWLWRCDKCGGSVRKTQPDKVAYHASGRCSTSRAPEPTPEADWNRECVVCGHKWLGDGRVECPECDATPEEREGGERAVAPWKRCERRACHREAGHPGPCSDEEGAGRVDDIDVDTVAGLCHSPFEPTDPVHQLVRVVEELCLPDDCPSYTMEQMADYIRDALRPTPEGEPVAWPCDEKWPLDEVIRVARRFQDIDLELIEQEGEIYDVSLPPGLFDDAVEMLAEYVALRRWYELHHPRTDRSEEEPVIYDECEYAGGCEEPASRTLWLCEEHFHVLDRPEEGAVDTDDPAEGVIPYLLGEGTLDGFWFGEGAPEGRGAFWWRSALRSHVGADPERGLVEALDEAVGVLYLDDSSDYAAALWRIIRKLDPEIHQLMLSDRKAAFDEMQRRLRRGATKP